MPVRVVVAENSFTSIKQSLCKVLQNFLNLYHCKSNLGHSVHQVKGKGGGFVNRLVLNCVRSGQSKVFRVLQKPERSPMRALRTSPSGRCYFV